MAHKDDYLNKRDIMEIGRFLASDVGMNALRYLRAACPRLSAKTDDILIRNAIGFDFWHNCIDALEKLGELPAKPDKPDDDRLET